MCRSIPRRVRPTRSPFYPISGDVHQTGPVTCYMCSVYGSHPLGRHCRHDRRHRCVVVVAVVVAASIAGVHESSTCIRPSSFAIVICHMRLTSPSPSPHPPSPSHSLPFGPSPQSRSSSPLCRRCRRRHRGIDCRSTFIVNEHPTDLIWDRPFAILYKPIVNVTRIHDTLSQSL